MKRQFNLWLTLALALLTADGGLMAAELTAARNRPTPSTLIQRSATQPVAYGSQIASSPTDPTDLDSRITTLETASSSGGTTQQLSGNWATGGASLNLQLTPGNRIELITPTELKQGGSSTPATPTVSVKTGNYQVVPGDKGSIIAYDGAADATFTLPDIEETSSATSADVSETGWSVTFFNLSNNSVAVDRTAGDNLELDGVIPSLRRGSSVTFTVLENGSNGSWGATSSTIAQDLSDYLQATQSARVTGRWEFIRELAVALPTSNTSAANKGYVDQEVSAEATTRTNADNARLQLSGGTMTGALTLSGAPTSDLHAATKKYVDDNAGGGGGSADTTWDLVELGQLTLVGFSKDASVRSTTRTNFGNIASFTGASQILSYNDLHGKIYTVQMPSRGGFLDLADLGTVNTPSERAAINGSTFFFCNTATVGAAAITIGGIGSVFPAGSTIEPEGCVEIFLFAAPTTTAFADGKFFNLIVSPHDEIEPRARYRASTSAPASNFGNDGDVVLQRQSATETRIYEKVSGTWHLRQTITSGGGGSLTFSSAAPVRPDNNAGAPGTAATPARSDHKHPLPALATRTSGGLMSHGDKQLVDEIAGIEHRVSDLSATAHDNWSDLPNGNAAAFRMVGVNQAGTLTSSAWGHRHQALLTNENYVVMMRIPLADSLAQYRLTVGGTLVAPHDWSEGAPDATYRYFGGVGTIQAARNAFVQMQRSTRTWHTTYDGDLTEAAKRRLNLAGDTPRRGPTLPATLPEGAEFWLTEGDVLPETLANHLFQATQAAQQQDRNDGGSDGAQAFSVVWNGVALADALYTGSPAIGTGPTVFATGGIRALYNFSLVSGILPDAWRSGRYTERYFLRVASALVTKADVDAGKVRLRLWVDATGGASAEETLVQISDEGGVKTLATPLNTGGDFDDLWINSPTLYFGVRHTDDGWLHSDLSFDDGRAVAKGLYTAASDGVPYRLTTQRAPNVLQAAVNAGDSAGATSIELSADYSTGGRTDLEICVWDVSGDDIICKTIPLALIAAQTEATRDYLIGRDATGNGATVMTFTLSSRAITLSGSNRIVYAVEK